MLDRKGCTGSFSPIVVSEVSVIGLVTQSDEKIIGLNITLTAVGIPMTDGKWRNLTIPAGLQVSRKFHWGHLLHGKLEEHAQMEVERMMYIQIFLPRSAYNTWEEVLLLCVTKYLGSYAKNRQPPIYFDFEVAMKTMGNFGCKTKINEVFLRLADRIPVDIYQKRFLDQVERNVCEGKMRDFCVSSGLGDDADIICKEMISCGKWQ